MKNRKIIETTFLVEDVKNVIQEVCANVSSEMKSHYVHKRKIQEQEFTSYILAIEQLLQAEYLEGVNGAVSNYEWLNEHLPQLPKEEYLKKHRIIFEYLVKLSRERAKEKLKTIAF